MTSFLLIPVLSMSRSYLHLPLYLTLSSIFVVPIVRENLKGQGDIKVVIEKLDQVNVFFDKNPKLFGNIKFEEYLKYLDLL